MRVKIHFSNVKPAIGTNRPYQSSIISMLMQAKYKIDIIFNNSINPRTMTKFLKSGEVN